MSALTDILRGSQTVGEFFIHIWQQYAQHDAVVQVSSQWINGSPGMLIIENEALTTALTLDIDAGRIQRIYAIRNPDKLDLFSG